MGTYLGQNFLIDHKIRRYIAGKISVLYHKTGCQALIEIGPGKGSITKLIDTISPNFFIIEKDSSLALNLKLNLKSKNCTIVQADVLDVDIQKLLIKKNLYSDKTLVVGNLPYYVTSPILRKFFTDDTGGLYKILDDTGVDDIGGGKNRFAGGVLMVQNEVGQKIRSDAKKKSYLRWLINYAYDIIYLKGVPAKCFKPAPKVKSCLIELKIKNGKLRIERDRFVEFLELFAPFSRKTLGAIQTMIKKHGGTKYQAHSKNRVSSTGEKNREKSSKVKKGGETLRNPISSTAEGHSIKNIGEKSGKGISEFVIPEALKKKRLEELNWIDLEKILC